MLAKIIDPSQREIQRLYLNKPSDEASRNIQNVFGTCRRRAVRTSTTVEVMETAKKQGDTNLFVTLARADDIIYVPDKLQLSAVSLYTQWAPLPRTANWGDILYTLPEFTNSVSPNNPLQELWVAAFPRLIKELCPYNLPHAKLTACYLLQVCPSLCSEVFFSKVFLEKNSLEIPDLFSNDDHERAWAYYPLSLMDKLLEKEKPTDIKKRYVSALTHMASINRLAQICHFVKYDELTPKIASTMMTAAIEGGHINTALVIENEMGGDRQKAISQFSAGRLFINRKQQGLDALEYFQTTSPKPKKLLSEQSLEPLETGIELL